MSSSFPSEALSLALTSAIALTGNVENHPQAHEAFEELLAQLPGDQEPTRTLLKQLWHEYVSARRSERFWQEMSDVEKAMGDRIAQSNMQLQQNYLRIIQEQ